MFGLDGNIVKKINHKLALKRVINDVQTDFIYAPHINAIYALAGEELWSRLSTKLKNGTFNASLPINIEVPKPSSFTRPGSILRPYDRMSYQIAVGHIAIVAEKQINRSKVFSNVLLSKDQKGLMFKPPGESFSRFRDKLIKNAKNERYSYVLKSDVASYFPNINQHTLITLLISIGCETPVVRFLEKLLSFFTEKSSRGIIQGVAPSDFLGNFYLCYLDGEYSLAKIPFLRFVDDIYSFFNSRKKAFLHKLELINWLRKEGLYLNEYKTKILPTKVLLKEETEVQKMLEAAKEEIILEYEEEFETRMEEETGNFYSSTIQWDFLPSGVMEPEIDYEEVEIDATKKLFRFKTTNIFLRDKIDRFCIPVFAKFKDSFAIEYTLKEYIRRPYLAQIFANYIGKTIHLKPCYTQEAEKLLFNKDLFFEYQYVWLYAALMSSKKIKKTTVDFATKQLRNGNLNEALRAVCAIFIGKFGNAVQRKSLKHHYKQEQSDYVCSAILYAARYFPAQEKNACYKAWCGNNELNSLVSYAVRKI